MRPLVAYRRVPVKGKYFRPFRMADRVGVFEDFGAKWTASLGLPAGDPEPLEQLNLQVSLASTERDAVAPVKCEDALFAGPAPEAVGQDGVRDT